MKTTTPLQPGQYYHIYNRGNNRENLFREERNYPYFLRLCARYLSPVAETLAYCLMPNHFHLLMQIRVTNVADVSNMPLTSRAVTQHFSNLFNAYTKAINKAYARTGSLFEERFGRIPVTSERYLRHLLFYIHFNPQKHGFVSDFRDWPWSSYHSLRASGETKLNRAAVLSWFGGVTAYEEFHQGMVDERALVAVVDTELG